MTEKDQLGYASFQPYEAVDEETGEPTTLLPADAVAPEARPGEKAGNYLIDRNNEVFRRQNSPESDLLDKMKDLYDKSGNKV